MRTASALATLLPPMNARAVLVALALLGSACTSDPPRPATEPEVPAPREVVPEVVEPAPEVLPEARTVRITTEDGVTLVGDLQPATRPDAPLVILVHQLGSDRGEWSALRERLHAAPSIATLAVDVRGHGESTESTTGALDFHAFDAAAWAATANDVIAAVAFVTSPESGLQPNRIAAVGASIGSTAVVAAAAREPRIATFVAISPGRAYHGFDSLTPMLGLGDRHFLTVVSRDETEGVETAEAMARITHGEAIVVDGTAHGVSIFAADPTTLDRTVTFLREDLGASAP